MTATKIEWATDTWNPVTGCTRVSPGCEHCYIERTPPMRMQGRRFDGPQIGAATGVTLHPERLDQPLRWRKRRPRVFVNSMSDLFHPDVPDEFIARVWAVMAATPQHTYLVLTKRPARMRALLGSADLRRLVADAVNDLGRNDTFVLEVDIIDGVGSSWPLPNVVLVVSVEDQRRADERIPLLLDTPAAVRGISAEPLLGPIDLEDDEDWEPFPDIDWVIVGGESGPGARPMHPDWARDLRDQCVEAWVPFFFKQWGEYAWERIPTSHAGAVTSNSYQPVRVGKKAAGRLLDGRTWDEFPEVARG